jgi:hypothetical protein
MAQNHKPLYQIVTCTGMDAGISEVKILRKGKIVHRCDKDEADRWVQTAIADEAHPNFHNS